ncbi:MAG: hypothetical protein V9E81_13425 [Marmoricola sp.]
MTDKAGTFVNWEGRLREPFEQAFETPASLPDLRDPGRHRRPSWASTPRLPHTRTGRRPDADDGRLGRRARRRGPVTKAEGAAEGLVLASWKHLIDDGRMQDGDPKLRATARKPVVLVGAATLSDLGVRRPGPMS